MFSFKRTLYHAFVAFLAGASAIEVNVGIGGGTVDVSAASYSKPKVAVSWYAGFHAQKGFPLSKVNWSKYTHLTYSFAETTPDVRLLTLNGSDPDLLPQFVSQAKQHGVKALVSVGGWTGSRYFSSNVGSAENRTQFVKTLTDFAREYHLDGLDFDWEYPGRQGIGCNTISPSDTANFLALLQELRQDPLGCKLILSAAVSVVPFAGPDGNPLSDVSPFAKVLDWIAVMNYDVYGPWSPTVGPNAPLDDTCAGAGNQFGSAVSAVGKWSAAGIPTTQIVLGVPGYGHSFRVRRADAFLNGTKTLAPYPKFNATDRPTGDSWDDPETTDECGAPQAPGGTVNFWGLIQEGYLNKDGSVKKGISSAFDDCSQTPYVYNADTEIMVSYDNAKSFAAKGEYIKSTNLRGFSLWEAGGDYKDILIDSIRSAAGIY